MSKTTVLRASIDSKRKVYCFECEDDLGEGDQCIAVQTPITVNVYYVDGVRAGRKSIGSNIEARCERCGKINHYPLNYWEERGEPVQS